MENQQERKIGLILVFSVIVVGVLYQLLNLVPISMKILDPISVVFNAALIGAISFAILKDEFTEWYKHFSVKWIIIGIPFLLLASMVGGKIWQVISGAGLTANSINDMLTWKYVISHIPFMLMGEELLSITLLYALWKKISLKFWQASVICSILFALWHLTAYSYNVPQILITLTAPRLVLNYVFKKSNSIWSSWIVHIVFDTLTFIPFLIK